MLVMTAKLNMKKILTLLVAAAVVIAVVVMLFGGKNETAPTAAPSLSSNDGRVAFLTGFGWEVVNSPTESTQVKIPQDAGDVFQRYNALQKSQGYDLSQYAGKTVMRYVYEIKNYPNATEPVYATLLIYKNQVIGGDVTDTAAKGRIQGFAMPESGTAPTRAATVETTPETAPTTRGS